MRHCLEIPTKRPFQNATASPGRVLAFLTLFTGIRRIRVSKRNARPLLRGGSPFRARGPHAGTRLLPLARRCLKIPAKRSFQNAATSLGRVLDFLPLFAEIPRMSVRKMIPTFFASADANSARHFPKQLPGLVSSPGSNSMPKKDACEMQASLFDLLGCRSYPARLTV